MKKILALFLATLLVFAFTACSGNASIPDGYKIASNADVCDYTLFVPETWITGNTGSSVTTATVSNSDSCNISVSPLKPGNALTVGELWINNADEYRSLFGESFTVLEEGAQVKVGTAGYVGYRYVFTAKQLGKDYKFMQIFFVHGDNVYAFTYTATYDATGADANADHYNKHLEIVNSILSLMAF